ncbi:MAG: RNA polymerase sigma factor RpoD [Phycisphaerae bacterium]|nr:RNA polymerase sigma factor RpoD [Phycisphaerae bacterium]
MKKYRSSAVANLVLQLQRAPSRLTLRHLLQTEFLLTVVEADREYPFDFVVHTLTGYRPAAGSELSGDVLAGSALRADLTLMAEQLSEHAEIPAAACQEPVYSVNELAERFDVSTKTIFRWRQRGLIGWRLRFPDRRSRIVFPERCVRRFVAENLDLVIRGTSFSQLSRDERSAIVRRAGELTEAGVKTVNSVAKAIAAETSRAIETIRLILKSFDEAHPGTGIFNRPNPEMHANELQLRVWEAYLDGASIESLAQRFEKSVAWVYRTTTLMRAREMKNRRIEFVPSAEFDDASADVAILHDPEASAGDSAVAEASVPADLPPYFQQLFRVPLLSAARERALFRKFNYLKCKADRLREALDPDAARAVELDRVDALLSEAAAVKNVITQANLRLVVSIAKRHVRSGQEFYELISDGNVSLMKAVEKFDYSRGFKFSTYASWAIMKNFARTVPEQMQQYDRYQTGREEMLETVAGPTIDESDDDTLPALRGALDQMLDTLSQREQAILRRHFGLESGGQAMTLEEIGRELGVSKERVRQIEARAMNRLRSEFRSDALKLIGA